MHRTLSSRGAINDKYTVKFVIKSPKLGVIGMHYDWRNEVADVISAGGNLYVYKS